MLAPGGSWVTERTAAGVPDTPAATSVKADSSCGSAGAKAGFTQTSSGQLRQTTDAETGVIGCAASACK